MKIIQNIFFIFCVFIPLQLYASIRIVECGTEWINLHEGNPDLIGIYVQQYPDSRIEREAYEGKHPVMLIFLFKNDRAHTVIYSPTGQIQSGTWWDVSQNHWVKKAAKKEFKHHIECAYWKKIKTGVKMNFP